ncbi:MAG TPA: PEGA domain-containing protein [Terriglobales bacterium]|nr:PEGA domain-containing protein [Terriglobales bacterium]
MPSTIGRFEILGELSKSVSGAVYRANDPSMVRTIVLKTLRLDLPAHTKQVLVQLILQEAESTKVLNSQNIALLYGAGEIDGQFCAAMEYVEGNSLANLIARQEGFSIWDLLDISRQVCLALDHADSHAVVHRSLEPEKIMMQWDGNVKVLGYGVSTMVSAMPSQGTQVPPLFYYMSPEQVKGEVMDLRSNIFTWGAILYEMVTDRKPFTGEDIKTVRQRILEETPEPPATINPRMNLGVSRVIMQALSKIPEERYQHGNELMLDMEKAKETTQAKAAKGAQPAQGLVIPEKLKATSSPAKTAPPATDTEQAPGLMNSAGTEVAPQKAAAVAAAGNGGAAVSASSTAKTPAASPKRVSATMSAATAEAPPEKKSSFAVDPMMAEQASTAAKNKSFSELDELPPLKETYFPPPAQKSATEAKPAPAPAQTFALRPRTIKDDKPKVITRENAKRAVHEIKKVPPKLVGYSVAAAAVVILAVIIAIGLYIHYQSPDEQSVAPQQPVTTEAPPQAAAQEAAQPEPQPEAAEPALTEQTATQAVEVKPRYQARKRKSATPMQPTIVPGELAISSTPEGALVQIDGRTDPTWVTPYTATGLPPGQHTLNINKPGYVSDTRSVQVASGSKSFLVIHLAQLGTTVSISSEPAGASVFIDGKDTGHVTPMQTVISDKASHIILVRKQGYLDETTSASFASGQPYRYAPVLKPLGITDDIKVVGKFGKLFGGKSGAGMGKVSVHTQPKGAQVTVNRRMVDKPTPVDFLLNPGNYMIDISLPGYKPVHRVITVGDGPKIELNENLEPE